MTIDVDLLLNSNYNSEILREKTMKFAKFMLTAAAGMAIASSAYASTYTIKPVISRSFDPATGSTATALTVNSPTSATANTINAPVGSGNRVYQVDFYIQFSDPTNNNFGALNMDLSPITGVTRPAAQVGSIRTGWLANNPFWDSDNDGTVDPANDARTYGDNADLGTANDLVGIVLDIDPLVATNANDPRPTLGKVASPGSLLGSIWVTWNGTAQGKVTADLKQGGFYNPTTNLLVSDLAAAPNDSAANFNVPEPSSIALLGLGGLAAIRRRRA